MADTVHYCEVCGKATTAHPQPAWILTTRFFIPPCCKGCGCQTYEEFLANATEEERRNEK